jgi:DNA invertase Pin-like site-specific DNA recombinase
MNVTEAANGRPLRVVLYGRVSTHDQSVDMQLVELRRFAQARGWKAVDEFADKGISGAKTSRPEFDRMMKLLRRRDADVLLCWKYDRVGRSTSHLLSILEELRALNIGFCSMTEGVDTTTPAGKMVFTFLAGIAEFERGLTRERVLAGIQNARARGVRFGRPRVGFDIAAAVRMRKQGMSVREVARTVGVSPATVFRVLRALEQSREGSCNAQEGATKASAGDSETMAQP